ncbi:sacsin N-terminal ATP-binding-like domain-containing protein [Psychroserpens mesophilus]|uniref:sacsin N-terminal ATP-binding-like domain-containing protein n=1 Tax=Psychroserpens mesophilus TaxID=325473 RepID=UPI0005901581|nr:DUF3883 domain-containing protein [Psychroserpens mesophilus]
MCATYRDKQKRAHFESFANKIFTGIREIKPDYAEKRAIWELFQNALDTVEENGIIEIFKTEKGLLFKHDGRPFKDDEFGGLIKQFSVGKSYGDNKDKLGQYGTGFISTHVYGKVIEINGSIKLDDGTFRVLENFKLDRIATSIDELTDKLLAQDELIEDLCDDTEATKALPLPFTTFEYHANSNEKSHITRMLDYIESIIPYIFCFNNKLSEVNILKENFENKYRRVGESKGVVTITKNNVPIEIPILENREYNVKVIIGDSNNLLHDIPKQFLFYPLMETVEAGYNFIIHANNFKPNKERDYLYQDSGNDELKLDVENNHRLLELGFDLVLKKIKNDLHISILDVAKIEFKDDDNQFNITLKSKYINEIRNLEKIVVNKENYSLNSFDYFDDSILTLDIDLIKSCYALLEQFYNLPSFDVFCELSKNVNNWNKNIDEKFDVLTLESIAEIIVKESGGNYYYINEKISYQKFIKQISEDVSLLNRLKLIPNIHGDFKSFECLVNWDVKEVSLIRIVDNINVLISERYVHEEFEFLENINTYNREEFKDNFSKYCNELIDDILKERDSSNFSKIRFAMLIESLTRFVDLNKKTQLNIDVASFYKRVFAIEDSPNVLSDPTVNINYQPAIKLLAHLYLKYLSDKEISEHILDLKNIVSIMFKNTNLKEELLHKLVCFPNQNFILKSQNELKRDNVKDDEFKNKFDEITNSNVRNELIIEGFEEFLQHSGFVSGSILGEEIETSLNSDKRFIPVQLGTIDTLLSLIEKISEKPNTWGEWLRNINVVKEEILMYKFKNAKIRSSLFSILTKNEETIELLGDLAKIDDLQSLIEDGKEKGREKARKNNHLQYINEIGLNIQNLVQNKLDKDLADTIKIIQSDSDEKLETIEEQNGQDFIIYKSGIPIYYIEVKSRWASDGIVALSKRQVECCAKNKDKYAVITVNVADYKARNKIIEENISFDELSNDIYVNVDLGDNFEKLIKENQQFEVIKENAKLIEFRGHIPQERIRKQENNFEAFIENLKTTLINHA